MSSSSAAATTAAAALPAKRHVLFYTYVDNMLEKRGPVRPTHLEHANKAVAAGHLLAGGAFMPDCEGGLLVFDADRATVEEFAKNDPYVTSKLVTKYEIKEWFVVVGNPNAAAPAKSA